MILRSDQPRAIDGLLRAIRLARPMAFVRLAYAEDSKNGTWRLDADDVWVLWSVPTARFVIQTRNVEAQHFHPDTEIEAACATVVALLDGRTKLDEK